METIININKIKILFWSLFLVPFLFLFSCSKDDEQTVKNNEQPQKSKDASIISFEIEGSNGSITGKSIEIDVPFGTDLSKLKAVVEISAKATIDPDPSKNNDYTTPINFTVTAEDDKTENVYKVTVKADKNSDQKFDLKWKKVASDPILNRSSHGAVVFNGKILLMGGGASSGRANDVWSSSDGKTWNNIKANDNNYWSKRYKHGAVVYKNKIYLLGGQSSTESFNDVWSSSDGKIWKKEKANDNNGWKKRQNMGAVVFNNKIFIIAGADISANYYNDVWSYDGNSWTEEKPNDDQGFSKRSGSSALVFDNKIWLIGGFGFLDGGMPSEMNDVWSSSDGKNWTKVKENSDDDWKARSQMAVVVYNNKMVIMGGSPLGNEAIGDIWYSSNGKDWTNLKNNNWWEERFGHTGLIFNNKIWIIGGFWPNPNSPAIDDIWVGQ